MEAQEAVRIEADLAKVQALAEKEHAAALVIESPDQYRLAVEALRQASSKHREIEAQRKRATGPLDEAKKQIMDWFRPAVDNLTSAIAMIRKSVATYEATQKQREVEAAAAYARASEAEKPAAKQQLVKAFDGAVEKIEGVQKRTIWKFEIVDEAQIPREYLVPDEKRIGGVVRAMKGEIVIPGVRVYAETSLAVNGADHE